MYNSDPREPTAQPALIGAELSPNTLTVVYQQKVTHMVYRSTRDKLPYDVPLDTLEETARSISGWSLSSMKTTPNAVNRLVTELRFAHRGGLLFPKRKLMIAGVRRVHEFVLRGTAHVWVEWEAPAPSAR